MDSKIDEALSRFVGLTRHELELVREDENRPAAELVAAQIILKALDGESDGIMKLLVERVGGKAIQKQLSITAQAGSDAAAKLAAMLGSGSGRAQLPASE